MRRHELDLFSLVAGAVFVLIAAGHLLDVAVGLDIDGRWVAPVVLVGLGVAGLAGVLGRRDDHDYHDDHDDHEAAGHHGDADHATEEAAGTR